MLGQDSFDMGLQIGFGAGCADCRMGDSTLGHVERGHQTLGAMTQVFKFLLANPTGIKCQLFWPVRVNYFGRFWTSAKDRCLAVCCRKLSA